MKVVLGIVENGRGEVLLAQRPPGKSLAGLWEFPGGKIEGEESPQAALRRELQEELELDVEVGKFLGAFPYDYDWGSIELHSFIARALSEPRPTEDVHVFNWVAPNAIDRAVLAPADIEPLKAYLKAVSGPSAE